MKQVSGKSVGDGRGWLLFFYSIPSKPVSNRMKIWRKLARAGAIQLKGAVYILPLTDEHYEFFQWLVSEVSAMDGEAAFTRVECIDSMKDHEIIALFNRHKEDGYQTFIKSLEELETKVNSIRKGSKPQNLKGLSEQLTRVSRSFEEERKTDFFSSKTGRTLQAKIVSLNDVLKSIAGVTPERETPAISPKRIESFRGKTWVSRKKPFVDRMASAWLIRRFIDKDAVFEFSDEKGLAVKGKDRVTFDVSGGEFTHVGDLCTFEVLMKAFGIKDRAAKKIAEIVHELDIKDEKYSIPDAKGIGEVLTGIRKTAKNDDEALEKGMAVFEMLYASKS